MVRTSRFIALAAALLLSTALASPAQAETRHTSYMATASTVHNSTNHVVPTWQAPLSGLFVVGKGRTVQMNCWTTGVYASGSGKWFQITVLGSGTGYGVTGYVPANTVAHQWMSSPHC